MRGLVPGVYPHSAVSGKCVGIDTPPARLRLGPTGFTCTLCAILFPPGSRCSRRGRVRRRVFLLHNDYVVHRFSFVYDVMAGETTIVRCELLKFESVSPPSRVEWPHGVLADSRRVLLPASPSS